MEVKIFNFGRKYTRLLEVLPILAAFSLCLLSPIRLGETAALVGIDINHLQNEEHHFYFWISDFGTILCGC
jgi:hypothetical protein